MLDGYRVNCEMVGAFAIGIGSARDTWESFEIRSTSYNMSKYEVNSSEDISVHYEMCIIFRGLSRLRMRNVLRALRCS